MIPDSIKYSLLAIEVAMSYLSYASDEIGPFVFVTSIALFIVGTIAINNADHMITCCAVFVGMIIMSLIGHKFFAHAWFVLFAQEFIAWLLNPEWFKMREKSFEYRMLQYEFKYNPKIPYRDYLVVRLNGKFEKPTLFQKKMVYLMNDMITNFHACVGYTFGDEIVIIVPPDQLRNERIQTIASTYASHCAIYFGERFETRAMLMPGYEAINYLLWRSTQVCMYNNIHTYAKNFFKTKMLYRKNTAEIESMLHEKGIDLEKIPNYIKYGVYAKLEKYEKKNPNGNTVTRTRVVNKTMKIVCDPETVSGMLSKYWDNSSYETVSF